MIRAISITIALCFVLLMNACFPLNEGPKGGLVEAISSKDINADSMYRKEINALAAWIKQARSYDDSGDYFIFENELFSEMYRNSKLHFKLSKNYLLDETIEMKNKKLVIRLLQCLSLAEYLELGLLIVELNDEELSTVYLSPGPEYGFILDKNYQEKGVQNLLDEVVRKQPTTSASVELIKTGENFKRYEELIKFGENLPVLSCSSIAQ